MRESGKKTKDFKYQRTCKLPSCNKPFGTNREWQFFHWPECQKEWWRLLKKGKETMILEIEILKKEIKSIKAFVGMTKKEGK